MKNGYIFLFLLIALCSFTSEEKLALDDSFATLKKLRIQVLKKDIVGKTFEYDLADEEGCNKTEITYLGRVTTTKNKSYKLLNSFYVWGSCRGTSRLVIYDTNNVLLGNYYFHGPLPKALKNNVIVFEQGERVSFRHRLPNRFMVYGHWHEFDGGE